MNDLNQQATNNSSDIATIKAQLDRIEANQTQQGQDIKNIGTEVAILSEMVAQDRPKLPLTEIDLQIAEEIAAHESNA